MESMHLKLKPAKCYSLSMKSGAFDKSWAFTLHDHQIATIEQSPMKFLGCMVYPQHQKSQAASHMEEKLQGFMDRVDSLPLRGSYKTRIYAQYISACLRFDLSIHDVTETRLHGLDVIVQKSLRSWLKVPKSTHIGIAFHSEGLDIPLPSELYRFGHASVILSAGQSDRLLSDAGYDKSTHPSNGAMHLDIIDLAGASSSSAELKQIATAVRDSRIEAKARVCSKQGCGVELLASMEKDQEWKSCLYGLSQPTYSFIVNSMCDSLPTKSNLKLWNKILTSTCTHCNANESMLHVLNACPRMLDKYKWRHDNILHHLHQFVIDNMKDNCDIEVYCDILVSNDEIACDKFKRTIPDDIYLTNVRPDLVTVNRKDRVINVVELTIPFETNFRQAYMRKAERYKELISGIEQGGFRCNFFSLEIGSRGIINQGTSCSIRKICGAKKKDCKAVINKMSTISMKCSYVIFRDRCNASYSPTYLMH